MKFVKPLQFFEELLKRRALRPREHNCNYELTGRLLGLNVGDNYVALAVSNSANVTALPLRPLHRQENDMCQMANAFQTLISEHNVVGFVVGFPYSRKIYKAICRKEMTEIDDHYVTTVKNYINDLSKTGKFEGFKYTYWDGDVTSKNSEFVYDQYRCFTYEFKSPLSDTVVDNLDAFRVLQGYLDVAKVLVASDGEYDNKSGVIN
ncbi:hypothetical protein LWI29_031283 [Acer saccharum]|uniref:YqgF/RNase H-like domain-containing protein n=1 Tax=Acer saccharum TaxID=4024 RepID=A0AA39RMR0_ACESA|nr:hypothetical protein LWI29_031283 [Acer saccharum]KAK1554230.1 hypothetical protein Q3G72_009512 [Acer saccharum]